jgi:hypothetical protein
VRSPGILLVFSFDFLLSLRDTPVLDHTNENIIEDFVFVVLLGTCYVGSIKNNCISVNVNEVHFIINA